MVLNQYCKSEDSKLKYWHSTQGTESSPCRGKSVVMYASWKYLLKVTMRQNSEYCKNTWKALTECIWENTI